MAIGTITTLHTPTSTLDKTPLPKVLQIRIRWVGQPNQLKQILAKIGKTQKTYEMTWFVYKCLTHQTSKFILLPLTNELFIISIWYLKCYWICILCNKCCCNICFCCRIWRLWEGLTVWVWPGGFTNRVTSTKGFSPPNNLILGILRWLINFWNWVSEKTWWRN